MPTRRFICGGAWRVTLTGVVSEQRRSDAGASLATQFGALSVTNAFRPGPRVANRSIR